MQKNLPNSKTEKAYYKIWRERNKDKVIATRRRYYTANKEEIKRKAREYSRLNKEKISKREKLYRQANLLKIRERERISKNSRPEAYLFYSAKRRAKNKNIPFNIGIKDIIIPDVCPVLGIPLAKGEGKFSISSPSLDRIDPTKGYINGNILVISFRANNLKNDATLDEMKKIYEFYSNLKKEREALGLE